jgi:nicotinamide-nucleotide amidase
VRHCIHQNLIEEAEAVIETLRASNLSVVTAESCTGGLVAACLSHGKEASTCFHGGFVVYTKAQKGDVLGVDRTLLREQGAVNADVARQMAEGALRRSQASLSVSVTGVLGPDPDEDDNPAGLVYLGLAQRGGPTVLIQHEFSSGSPDLIREWTVLKALELVRQGKVAPVR